MRYQVEIMVNGGWVAKSWANTLRMAELQAIAVQEKWAKFGKIETRIIDTDNK